MTLDQFTKRVLCIFAALAVTVWGVVTYMALHPTGGQGVSVAAKPAGELKRAPTARVQSAPIKVYTGGTKAKLKLPDDVVKAPEQQVVAASQVPYSERPQTVTTILNTTTGETQTYVRQDPYPWFAVEARGEARLAIGYKLRDAMPKPVVRLGISQELFRIKAVTAGLVGTVDSDGDAFVGVGVAYRW